MRLFLCLVSLALLPLLVACGASDELPSDELPSDVEIEVSWVRIGGALDIDGVTDFDVRPDGTSVVGGRVYGPLPPDYDPEFCGGPSSPAVAQLDAEGVLVWQVMWPSSGGCGGSSIESVVAAPDGGVFIGGSILGTIDFGDGPSEPGRAFIARLSPSGELTWLQFIGGSFRPENMALAADRLIVTSYGYETVEFLGETVPFGDEFTQLIVSFDLNDGAMMWWHAFGGGTSHGPQIALSPTGDIVLCNQFTGTLLLGSGFAANSNSGDMYLATLDINGNTRWVQRFSSDERVECDDLTTDADGNIFIAGNISGPVDLGGGLVEIDDSEGVRTHPVVAKYDSSGRHAWSKSFTPFDQSGVRRIAVDGRGNLSVVGSLYGKLDIDGHVLQGNAWAGHPDYETPSFYLASFDPSGQHRYSHAATDSMGGVDAAALGFNDDDALYILGMVGAEGVSFNGASIRADASTAPDPFVAKIIER